VSNKTFFLPDDMHDYLVSVSVQESALLQRLREETAAEPLARMQISPEQGQFLALLARMIGARRALEVGVYTGYSSLCVALALPPDGSMVACDLNDGWTRVARRYWREAGVADRIDLRLAPALETLDALLADGQAGTFDFAFVDADKQEYPQYFERVLELLRVGGVMAIDNTLWYGRVLDPADDSEETTAIRRFNKAIASDPRVCLSLVPIGDGLTLALKR
jgi:predicted O-methyltransferase YrrM